MGLHECPLASMNLRARCPHCLQEQPVSSELNTQAAMPCRSCGQAFVPHKHLFVSTSAGPEVAQPPLRATRLDLIAAPTPLVLPKRASRPWLWACLFLAVALWLQVSLQQRHRLAASHPTWLLAWQSVCAVVGCEASPPMMLSEVAVVSSGFDQQPSGEFVLSLHVRHELAHAVATPSVELTLADDFDRPLVRKVFLPQQLGLPLALAAGDGVRIERRLVLDEDVQPHVSGFRIELFYP